METSTMPDLRYLAVAATLLAAPDALASADLARSRNCVACHHLERKMIGPAFTAIAARYADNAGAPETLSSKIRAGGAGSWGQMPMPPQANVSAEEADALAKWILAQR